MTLSSGFLIVPSLLCGNLTYCLNCTMTSLVAMLLVHERVGVVIPGASEKIPDIFNFEELPHATPCTEQLNAPKPQLIASHT